MKTLLLWFFGPLLIAINFFANGTTYGLIALLVFLGFAFIPTQNT
jgi:hypothetical protein